MLHPPTHPAQQLHSVALRFCHALTMRGAYPRHAGYQYATREICPPTTLAASSPFRRDEKLARVEALLFLAGEPLGSRKIAQLAGLADGTEARTLIRRLNGFYDSQSGAFRVEQVAGGFQMLTRRKFGGWLRRLRPSPVETRLSAPALETLAVVAYRQAVVRAEIESIRGVQCGEMLRQLMERDLVRIVGRSEELGRPYLYGTTKRFLQWFGLRNLDDLPRADLLRPSASRRENELTPRNDLNEEFEVKMVAKAESAPDQPTDRESMDHDRWSVASVAALPLPSAQADEEELDDDLDDDEDDDDDLDDDDDDDDLEDDDLEDDEWEEVDDDDDDWEDDDEDWDEDDEEDDDDEDEDEEWEDE